MLGLLGLLIIESLAELDEDASRGTPGFYEVTKPHARFEYWTKLYALVQIRDSLCAHLVSCLIRNRTYSSSRSIMNVGSYTEVAPNDLTSNTAMPPVETKVELDLYLNI